MRVLFDFPWVFCCFLRLFMFFCCLLILFMFFCAISSACLCFLCHFFRLFMFFCCFLRLFMFFVLFLQIVYVFFFRLCMFLCCSLEFSCFFSVVASDLSCYFQCLWVVRVWLSRCSAFSCNFEINKRFPRFYFLHCSWFCWPVHWIQLQTCVRNCSFSPTQRQTSLASRSIWRLLQISGDVPWTG